mmetsp:Transcript_37331/g.81280  ORF Transcript_37331/g.81280 Transcript_37331/m.81280 type:complete len:200 (-) Transcript_37331:1425-2024(-)
MTVAMEPAMLLQLLHQMNMWQLLAMPTTTTMTRRSRAVQAAAAAVSTVARSEAVPWERPKGGHRQEGRRDGAKTARRRRRRSAKNPTMPILILQVVLVRPKLMHRLLVLVRAPSLLLLLLLPPRANHHRHLRLLPQAVQQMTNRGTITASTSTDISIIIIRRIPTSLIITIIITMEKSLTEPHPRSVIALSRMPSFRTS